MTIDELRSAAAVVRDATEEGENTATRIGQLFLDTVNTLCNVSTNAIKGYVVISSTSDLPTSPTTDQQMKGYLLGTTLYVWVGTGGDTLDGKYQSAQLKGEDGKTGEKGDSGVHLGDVVLVNDLTTGGEVNALSAEMGKVLGNEVDTLKGIIKFKNNEGDTSGKYIYKNGAIWDGSGWSVSREISLNAGETINVTVPSIKENSIVIGRVINASSVYTDDAVFPTTGQTDYSYTATANCTIKIEYPTSGGFSAYIDNGYPTDNINERVDTILDRLGGVLIPFDQPKQYKYENDALVEVTGSLTTCCSTAKLNIADYKALFYSGCRSAYNGYFCAVFFDDNDNYVGQGLRPTNETLQQLQVDVAYDMVNVFEEIPQGATKVVLQTNINKTQYKHQVIGFTEVPYNFLQDIYWRQDYYGVKGDATTDDTAALQLLVDNSRGEVSLRQGTYLLGSTLKINTTKLKRFNGNGATFLVNSDITAIELIGSCSDNAGPTKQGEKRVNWAGFIIENATIKSVDDTEGNAIVVNSCLKLSITNCYIYHINNGIVINSISRDINIIGNNIYQCNSNGILFDTQCSLHQVNISANHISYCKNCIFINDSWQINNFQISCNDIEVSADYPANSDNCCVRIIGDTNTILLGEIEFVGNTIQGHTGSSVIIYAHGGSASVAKQVYGLSVIGNFISGCAGNAIELGNFNNIIVANNLVKGVDNSFIKVFDTANILSVNGNTLNGVPSVVTTDNSANLTHVGVNSNVATTNTAVTINGASQDYISVVGNTLGGGTITIGAATHKQEANNI